MRKGKPVAAATAEPDEDVWVELGEEWERFAAELEPETPDAGPETGGAR